MTRSLHRPRHDARTGRGHQCDLRRRHVLGKAPRGAASRVPAVRLAAVALALACLATAPAPALAQNEVFIYDIVGPIRAYAANPDPAGTDPDHILAPLPLRTISGNDTRLTQSGGMVLDEVHGELIAATLPTGPGLGNEIVVFDLQAHGNVAPKRVIGGISTGLDRPFGVALDSTRNEIVVANQDIGTLTFYPRTGQGNIPPLRTVSGLATPKHVTVAEASDELLVLTDAGVQIFGRTAGGGVTGPPRTISAFLNGPSGLGFDPVHDEIYVTNFAAGTGFVTVYRRSDGQFQRMIGPHPQIAFASAVAIDPVTNGGEVHVATFFAGGAVSVFTRTGTWLRTSNVTPPVFEPFFIALRTAPAPTTNLVAAVLPSGRAVMTGVTASAYVTIINTGTAPALQVGISLATQIPATFEYYQTDPLTNALIPGTRNTPADIPSGGTQTYAIFITPTAAFGPVGIAFSYAGLNTSPVPTLPGINTLSLAATDIPVADAVALAATLSNDGILHLGGVGTTQAFVVAMFNVGVGDTIQVTADPSPPGSPLEVLLCQTDPATGNCITTQLPSLSLLVGSGTASAFGVFVKAIGPIANDPAVNRLFITFRSTSIGIVVGQTSIGVTTDP